MDPDVSYAASRSTQQESEFRGVDEPARELLDRCDVTKGGSERSATSSSRTRSTRCRLRGDGTVHEPHVVPVRVEPAIPGVRDHLRDPAQRRHYQLPLAPVRGQPALGEGPVVSGNYTLVPKFEQIGAARGWTQSAPEIGGLNAFIDPSTRELVRRPVLDAPAHRISASGVYEFPFGETRTGLMKVSARRVVRRPDVPLPVGPALADPAEHGAGRRPVADPTKDGQFIYGVQPCVGQRNASGGYTLFAYSVNYGCTEPFFLVREPFQARTAQVVDDRMRRPGYWQLDLNFAKTTQITDRIRFQLRVEAFNVFNSPMYDERDFERNTASDDFGRINRNITGQSNFQRVVQLGFKLTF